MEDNLKTVKDDNLKAAKEDDKEDTKNQCIYLQSQHNFQKLFSKTI